MSWATKYRLEFKDHQGIDWKIDIQEDSFSGSITDLVGTGQPLVIEYNNNSDDVFDPIKSSMASINVWSQSNFALMGLIATQDMQFRMVVYQEEVEYWKGYVINNSYKEPYNDPPYEVTITACCGLELLQNYLYASSVAVLAGVETITYYTGRRYESQIILDILGKIAYTGFREYINIYDDDMVSTVDDSPMDQVKIDVDVFKNISCYETLEEVLKKYNACIILKGGEFCIYRPVDLKSATVYGRIFTAATTKTSTTLSPAKDINRSGHSSTIRQINGGVLMGQPPAKTVRLYQDYVNKPSWIDNYDVQQNSYLADDGQYQFWTPGAGWARETLSGMGNGLMIARTNGTTPPSGFNYVSQSFGSYAVVSDDVIIFSIDYMTANFTGAAVNGVKAYIRIKSDSANKWLKVNDDETYVWDTSAACVEIPINVPVGKSGWSTFSRKVASIPTAGSYTITMWGIDTTSIVYIVYTNIKFYSTSDVIIRKIRPHHGPFPNLARKILGVSKYINEYIDVEEVTENDYVVSNAINGEELEYNYRLGDVTGSTLDNVVEQFAGALAIVPKQYRVDTVTLTGTEGIAMITIDEQNPYFTYTTDLTTTAAQFVLDYADTFDALGITVTSDGAEIIFTAQVKGVEFTGNTTITNLEGDLNGFVIEGVGTLEDNLLPTDAWTSRGGSENKELLEIIGDEIAEQNYRPKHLIQMPIFDTGANVSAIDVLGCYDDSLNLISSPGSLSRKMVFNRGTFYAKERKWEIDLMEILDSTVPDGDPSSLTATADESDPEIVLEWTNGSTDEDGISIERSTDNATWAEIATVAAAETSYTDDSCVGNTAYYYRVRAYKDLGYSDYSNTANDTTAGGTAPVFVSAVVENATPTKVTLTYDQVLDETSTPSTTDFTVTSETVSGVLVTGLTVVLTLAAALTVFDAPSVTYTAGANPIKGSVGGISAANLGSTAITNNVAHDGNTVAWYLADDLTTITKDGSNLVSRWNDKLASGHDLLQAAGTNQPLWVSPGTIRFDGVDNFMKTAAFTWDQPWYIYFLIKALSFTDEDRIFTASGSAAPYLKQETSEALLRMYGTAALNNSNFALNTWKIVRCLGNGANSKLGIDANITTGNLGTTGLDALCLASKQGVDNYSNIEVKEIICRKVADDANTEDSIYNYLVSRKP